MKQVGEEEFVVMRGSYQYIGADGNFFLFSTMRKNLPKTLDQLIFSKFTKYLVNVHKIS